MASNGTKHYKFYTDSRSAWSAMFSVIKDARDSIYWETYIFEDDLGPEYDFFRLLEEKAKAGVKVRIVLDGFGSMNLDDAAVDRLQAAGVEVLFFGAIFGNWLRRVHRKILIVDEETAFLGGVNVGKRFMLWKDLNVRLIGRRVVRALVKSFGKSYRNSGGTDPHLLSLKKERKPRKAGLRLLESFPWMGKLLLRSYYKEKISAAEKSIVLVTPYFIPHRWLVRALQSAKARGVTIEMIIPENTDSSFISFANYVFISSLHESGIKFYMTKDMIHAKTILVDDRVGLVGSGNIDALSFDWNVEAGVSFEKVEMVRDLKNIIEIWKEDSKLFDPADYVAKYSGFYYKFLYYIVHLVQPVL